MACWSVWISLTDEFSTNSKVWLGCQYLGVTKGGTGGCRVYDILFCTFVAIDVELFNDCERLLGLAVLVTLDMKEMEGHRGALGDGLIDG